MKEIEDIDYAKYMNAIKNHPMYNTIITELDFNIKKKKWYIAYNPKYISVPDKIPGFDGTKTTLNDEEFIRALLLLKLSKEYQYHPAVSNIVLEKTYEAPGRPKKDVKGGRVDILLHDKEGNSFLFIECKRPQSYDLDQKFIKGQLFQLSKLETPRPKYLVYITVEELNNNFKEKCIVISTDEFDTYEEWEEAGKPSGNAIPVAYGEKIRKSYANVKCEDEYNGSFMTCWKRP